MNLNQMSWYLFTSFWNNFPKIQTIVSEKKGFQNAAKSEIRPDLLYRRYAPMSHFNQVAPRGQELMTPDTHTWIL